MSRLGGYNAVVYLAILHSSTVTMVRGLDPCGAPVGRDERRWPGNLCIADTWQQYRSPAMPGRQAANMAIRLGSNILIDDGIQKWILEPGTWNLGPAAQMMHAGNSVQRNRGGARCAACMRPKEASPQRALAGAGRTLGSLPSNLVTS